MYCRNYRHHKMSLGKGLKSPVSEEALTNNMSNGPKKSLNLGHRTFGIFIEQCEDN